MCRRPLIRVHVRRMRRDGFNRRMATSFMSSRGGTMTDFVDPELADMTFTSPAELQAEHDVKELPE